MPGWMPAASFGIRGVSPVILSSPTPWLGRTLLEWLSAPWAWMATPAAAANYWMEDMAVRDPYPESRQAVAAVAEKCRVVVLSNADDCFLDPVLARLDFPFATALSSEGARCYKPQPRNCS